MAVFPFLQKIDGRQFLVVGDGAIAWRKAKLLCLFTDQVILLTDRTDKTDRADCSFRQIEEQTDGGTRTPQKSPVIKRRRFCPSDLEKADYCIASTDDSGRNHWIAALCRDAGIPVNVPDAPSLCTFYLPSVIKKGDLIVAVSTNGKSPAFSARLRREIDQILPTETEEILNRMGELREWAVENIPDAGTRSALYHTILTELLLGGLPPDTETVLGRAGTWSSISTEKSRPPDECG